MISVKLENDHYGFLGKFQALSCSWDIAAKEISKILISQDQMLDAYINAIRICNKYDDANILSELLPFIKRISGRQVTNIISAFNENGQVRDSFGFNGKSPYRYGGGVVPHLNRLIGKIFELSRDGMLGEAI